MSKVKIVKAYQKGTNAVFKLNSVNEDPFLPVRSCYVTKPMNSFKQDIESYVGKEYPGRIVFDEAVNAKPKTAFNLLTRYLPDNEIVLYEVYDGKNQFRGYLERYWRFTKSNRSDYKIDRGEYSIVPVSRPKSDLNKIVQKKFKV